MLCTKMKNRGWPTQWVAAGIVLLSMTCVTFSADAQIKVKHRIKNKIGKIQPYSLEVRTLQTSFTQGTLTLSSGVRWDCKGTICTANVKYPDSGTKACNALARAVGPLRSFHLVKQPSKIKTVKGFPFTTTQISDVPLDL